MSIRNTQGLTALLLCLVPYAASIAQGPYYDEAPGKPVCSGGDPLTCVWTADNLTPPPKKFAVEVVAFYDSDGDQSADLSRLFKLTTVDGEPTIQIPMASLSTTVCVTNDDPCTTSETHEAQDVQVRVKGLHPSSRTPNGAQNNPFSDWSDLVDAPPPGSLFSDSFESP